MRTKLKLFNSLVLSVLLCGCESRKCLTEVDENVSRVESGCLRKIMETRWLEMISDEELRRRSGQPTIFEIKKTESQPKEMVWSCPKNIEP